MSMNVKKSHVILMQNASIQMEAFIVCVLKDILETEQLVLQVYIYVKDLHNYNIGNKKIKLLVCIATASWIL